MSAPKHWWHAVGVGTVTFAVVVLIAGSPVEDAIQGTALDTVLVAAFLLSWLGVPLGIVLDVRTVREDMHWDPSVPVWALLSLVWLLNVVVGSTYFVRRASAVRDDVPSVRWLYVVVGCWGYLAVTVMLDVALDGVIPDPVWDVLVVAWLVASGALPAALFLDAERLAGYTGWDSPQVLWVLGAAVPLVNLLVVLRYLTTRREVIDDADAPNTLSLPEAGTTGGGAPSSGSNYFAWAVAVFAVHLVLVAAVAAAAPELSDGGMAILALVTWPPFGVPFGLLLYRDMQATRERGVEYGLVRVVYLASVLVQGAAFWALLARTMKLEGHEEDDDTGSGRADPADVGVESGP